MNVLAIQGQEFISFGTDLNRAQREQMLKYFQPAARPQMLEVTNAEEYYYLSKYVPAEQIGSRAISSVYLKTLPTDSGIQVETLNITWVTDGMYANAAVTAGVKDVMIKAAAPFPVSGTAALTGIFKTFEQAQGQPIDSKRKETAYQELVITGQLGEEIGKENAEVLMRDVKEEVVKRDVKDPEEIRIIIETKAGEYNLELTEKQIQDIEKLMEKINMLNLNVTEINKQLKSLETKIEGIQRQGEKIKGILALILDLLQRLVNILAKIFIR